MGGVLHSYPPVPSIIPGKLLYGGPHLGDIGGGGTDPITCPYTALSPVHPLSTDPIVFQQDILSDIGD